MRLEVALEGVSTILLDTAPVVDYLEVHPRYVALMDRFMEIKAENAILSVTSPVTLSECLIQPVRRGAHELVDAYRKLVIVGEQTEFRIIGVREADIAARLRANYNLTLADAYQAAIAITSGCEAILTNDQDFKRVREIRAVVLDDLEP
jgi:predicted nucleic acid-binding protein